MKKKKCSLLRETYLLFLLPFEDRSVSSNAYKLNYHKVKQETSWSNKGQFCVFLQAFPHFLNLHFLLKIEIFSMIARGYMNQIKFNYFWEDSPMKPGSAPPTVSLACCAIYSKCMETQDTRWSALMCTFSAEPEPFNNPGVGYT